MHVELAVILHFGVVEKVSIDPIARRRLLGFGAEFIDDACDGDKLDLKRVADEDFVEQSVATRVIGVSILLCKRPGFGFGDGVPGKWAVPLPWPSDLEARRGFIGQLSPGPASVPAKEW